MPLLTNLIENLLVMILTVVALAGGIYLLLLLMHFWLKMKSSGREEQALSIIWEDETIRERMNLKSEPLEQRSSERKDES